ncbi:MAG: stage II sporulation protein R [Clostridia bacterium]|nr:stage II sporulation protein R [Clostridia bacterium]
MQQNSNKAKLLLLFALLLSLLMAQTIYSAQAANTMTSIGSESGILRLHIRANSDSERDQAVKMQVKEALLPYFEAAESLEDAKTFLLNNGDAIQQICERTLLDSGVDYGVYLQLGTESFPDRVYQDRLFPAGEYDALVVVLGEGGGQNWWCVLFPPLCIVTPDGETADIEELEFESDIAAWFKELIARWFK